MSAERFLPLGVTVLERGWLSSNNVLIRGRTRNALVDSGYCTHAAQTLALVQQTLGEAPLHDLVNTHLHSDHCGGNATLQAHYPKLRTRIPPGQADAVRRWDAQALSYAPTGQQCPRFKISGSISPGLELRLGDQYWQVHGAPGHDPHAIMLYEPLTRTLISGDALWEKGFGVVFPELEGEQAFAEVGASLDVVQALQPSVVIPGHGRPFTDVGAALAMARERLQNFTQQPRRHALYAAKVLVKFKLLEMQAVPLTTLWAWAGATPYFALLHQRYFADTHFGTWLDELANDLVRSGAAARHNGALLNA